MRKNFWNVVLVTKIPQNIYSRVPVKLYVCIYVGVTRYVLVKLSYYMPWRHLEGEEEQQLIHDLSTRWG
jgi:hypothetical protein